MHKTTLYLEDELLHRLKKRSMGSSRKESIAEFIRRAIRAALSLEEKKEEQNFLPHFRKLLQQKPRKSSFGDPVEFQRKIREEWD